MSELFKKCCEMCEAWGGENHDYQDCGHCPAMKMNEENEALKKKISQLHNEMSYMNNQMSIGSRHEMGG